MAEYSSLPKRWDYEADVIVVGAGTAGLPAAIMAADAGAKVAVLECMSYCASSLALVEVGPAFAGTDVQEAEGIHDSAELFYRDGMEKAKGWPEMWRLFTDYQLDTYYWCKNLGLKFEELFAVPRHSAKRGFFINAVEWLQIVEKEARERGAEILFLHRAMRLIRDAQTGRVAGLKVAVKGKMENFRANKAVILATGGFGRNRDMVLEYGPEYADYAPIMPPGHLGDGLKMAMAEGADTRGIGSAVMPSFQVDAVTKSGNMGFIAYVGGIFVNVHGKRFCDESTRNSWHGFLSREAMKQPGGLSWIVYDEKIRRKVIPSKFGAATPEQTDNIKALAEKAGIDVVGLNETVERYNGDIDRVGYDTEFDRRTLVADEGAPGKIDEPPFYAIRSVASTTSFKGGLRVNTLLQVVNKYDEPIQGLYACGEVAGGLWGPNGTYLPCTGISSSMTFGRIAGRNAAAEQFNGRPRRE
ncbi:MAG: FAD-binding protein [Thermodesulfobacteriota bacterium]